MDVYTANLDFIRALARRPADRLEEDLSVVYRTLRQLDVFHRLGDGPLRAICRSARYERHNANHILFRKGQLSTCWYILLSGSVFIEGQMFLPRASFGKRSGNSNRRPNDCLVLEPSEMIVIDYPDVQKQRTGGISTTAQSGEVSINSAGGLRTGVNSMNLDHPQQRLTDSLGHSSSRDAHVTSGSSAHTGGHAPSTSSNSNYYYSGGASRQLTNYDSRTRQQVPPSCSIDPSSIGGNCSSSSSTVSAGSGSLSSSNLPQPKAVSATPTSSLMRHRYWPRREPLPMPSPEGTGMVSAGGYEDNRRHHGGNKDNLVSNGDVTLISRNNNDERLTDNNGTLTKESARGGAKHDARSARHGHAQEASSSSSSNSAGTLIDEEEGSNPLHSSEPLREVETVIHRTEVYLSGSNVNTVGAAGSSHGTVSSLRHSGYGSTRSSSSSTSAYSGSTDRLHPHANFEDHDDLAGLPEGNVDSDEDDDESCPSGDSFGELRDCVRDCLEKDPSERNEDDILILQDFMTHMPAFASLPSNVRRELCLTMVFAIVEKAGKIVMNDGEQLDSWCVVVNGEVEVMYPDGSRKEYHLGDSFGIEPKPEPQFNAGTMRTLVDDCQFVLVTQQDFVRIMARVTENLKLHTDAAGEIVSETERRTLDSREGYVLIKGKPDKLLAHLMEERDSSVDPYYVEDYLLMYRTFTDPLGIFRRFMEWFADPFLKEKVVRLVLLWVNNHFNDFEMNNEMMRMLEQFEQGLENENMHNHQALLNIACSVKSRTRAVTYTRSNRDEVLHFSILGGYEKGYGIFISKVDTGSQAEKVGLKRGDEILEVNNTNFQHIPHQRALEFLRGATHLSISVKSNLLRFKEMLAAPEKNTLGPGPTPNGPTIPHKLLGGVKMGKKGLSTPALKPFYDDLHAHSHHRSAPHTEAQGQDYHGGQSPLAHPRHPFETQPSCPANLTGMRNANSYIGNMPTAASQPPQYYSSSGRPGSPSLPRSAHHGHHAEEAGSKASKLAKMIAGKLKMGMSSGSLPVTEEGAEVNFHPDPRHGKKGLPHSHSNPDISQHLSTHPYPHRPICPEHVLKIYKQDQSFKYLTVYKETTAQNVVQLALQEFGMSDQFSAAWSLTKVTVTPQGVIKQSRLPDQIHNLAEKIDLNSRYYLKRNESSASLVKDELAPEILKEAETQLVQLNANILAAQLTLQDFSVFSSIEPTEFVDELFKIKSAYGFPKLAEFEDIVNKEMWWVATEICREKGSVLKRAKLVKKFIKIARHCRDFRNFNSMFAILSGLDKPSVRRLHHTWEKVPAKYNKQLKDLNQLFSLARNMSTYRQLLGVCGQTPPCIPLFPVIKKDLTFIHEGNKTMCEGLVNFEKLRMCAKEIRAANNMASAPYELSSMFEEGDPNEALIHINPYDPSVATLKRTQPSRGPLPRKKLYERALMVRKVKSYLSNLQVIDSDPDLDRLSTECEPQLSAGSTGNVNHKKRMPSPSPSSTSSLSNNSDNRKIITGPKFGVESPQAVQKMLALVENSRLHIPSAGMSVVHFPRNPASPTPSPSAPRRLHRPHRLPPPGHPHPYSQHAQQGAMVVVGGHGRSHSESIGPAVLPVDLTAESSSVTTLLGAGGRISSTGSVTSTDSAVSQQSSVNISHAVSCDSTDSGHASMDAHSTHSHAHPPSPPSQRRSFPPPPPPAQGNTAGQLKTRPNPKTTNAHQHHGGPPSPQGGVVYNSSGRLGAKSKAPPPPSSVRISSSQPGNGALPTLQDSEQVSRV